MNNVYKYLSPERSSYLSNELLRFSQPDALNDPFELLPTISREQAANLLETYIRMSKHKPKFSGSRNERRAAERANASADRKFAKHLKENSDLIRERFFDDAKKSLNSKIGILSLSRRWDSALMWSHYTNAHTGFCVGFMREHLAFKHRGNPVDPTRMMNSVQYSDQRVPVSLIPGKPLDMKVIYTKSTDWSYEQEERVVAVLSDADSRLAAAPYDICLFKVPHESISEITLGLRASPDLVAEAKALGVKVGFNVYQAVLSENSFNVERIQIHSI